MSRTRIAGAPINGEENSTLAHVAAVYAYVTALRAQVQAEPHGSTAFGPLEERRRNRLRAARTLRQLAERATATPPLPFP